MYFYAAQLILIQYFKFIKSTELNDRDTTIMGNYSDYPAEDFLNIEEANVDIFIQNNKIHVMSAPKEIHEYTIFKLIKVIDSSLEQIKTDDYWFDGYGSSNIQLFNYGNRCPVFIKQPDFPFNIVPPQNRKHSSIVGEVARLNVNFKLFLDEIACYLNDFTHIQYFIGVIFLEQTTFKIRFVVAKRRTPQTISTSESESAAFIDEKKTTKKFYLYY